MTVERSILKSVARTALIWAWICQIRLPFTNRHAFGCGILREPTCLKPSDHVSGSPSSCLGPQQKDYFLR